MLLASYCSTTNRKSIQNYLSLYENIFSCNFRLTFPYFDKLTVQRGRDIIFSPYPQHVRDRETKEKKGY